MPPRPGPSWPPEGAGAAATGTASRGEEAAPPLPAAVAARAGGAQRSAGEQPWAAARRRAEPPPGPKGGAGPALPSRPSLPASLRAGRGPRCSHGQQDQVSGGRPQRGLGACRARPARRGRRGGERRGREGKEGRERGRRRGAHRPLSDSRARGRPAAGEGREAAGGAPWPLLASPRGPEGGAAPLGSAVKWWRGRGLWGRAAGPLRRLPLRQVQPGGTRLRGGQGQGWCRAALRGL